MGLTPLRLRRPRVGVFYRRLYTLRAPGTKGLQEAGRRESEGGYGFPGGYHPQENAALGSGLLAQCHLCVAEIK